MRVLFDPHTHTQYSHGKDSIEDNVRAAMEQGLDGIVISEHAPRHYYARHLNDEKYAQMRREIDRLKVLYPQINIYFALECNIISSSGEIDLSEKASQLVDFYYIGFHYLVRMKTLKDFVKIQGRNFLRNKLGLSFLFKHLEAFNTSVAVNAVKRNSAKMFVHPTSYVNLDIAALARACSEKHMLMEINSHRGKLTAQEIRKVCFLPLRFWVGSDAHCKEDVGNLENALAIVRFSGIDLDRVENICAE